MHERDQQLPARPVAKVGGTSFLGVSIFFVWVVLGGCFSLAFAAGDPLLRSLITLLVFVWAVLGPFALSFFLVETSTWFLHRGFYKASLAVSRMGIAVDNAVLPLVNLFGMVDSPIAVLNLLNEASALICLCQFKEAAAKLEDAVDKSQGAVGWDHSLTQIVVGQLASCYLYLGRFERAEQFFRRAIAAKVVRLPPDVESAESLVPLVASLSMDRYGLGSLMEKKLQFDQAEAQYKEAILTIDKYVFEDTDFLANHLNALGDLYVKTGRLEEAEPCIHRAFFIRKQIFPANHIVIASSYHSLGCLSLKLGHLCEARGFLADALEIRESFFGKSHPDVADTYRATGELETALNNFDVAEDYLSRSLAILDQTFGAHPDVARVLESLSTLYEKKGNQSHAEQFIQRAAEIRQASK